jgi:catechol 2,3-dioxygenase-like lactoylglutathione lyase family enzyme
MSNFVQITPFMHVRDLEHALDFFTGTLGFQVMYRQGNYAYFEREGVAFRLLEEGGPDGAPPGNRRFGYYIDVRDVDGLYAEMKSRLDALPHGDVCGPVDQAYGQRELLVVAPDGNVIAFGQPLPRPR